MHEIDKLFAACCQTGYVWWCSWRRGVPNIDTCDQEGQDMQYEMFLTNVLGKRRVLY